jgi:hypothetical protein
MVRWLIGLMKSLLFKVCLNASLVLLWWID